MKASRLRTIWIMLHGVFSIFFMSSRAVFWSLFGTLDRVWVDETSVTWAKKLLAQVKLDYHLDNPHNVTFEPRKPYIIMLNHSSHYDIPLTVATIPASMRMIGKKELFKIPIFGRAMRVSEHICVNRQHRQQAIKDLETAKQKLKSGIVIWICPEGTRSRDGKLAPFKKGGFIIAIETGATIIPVGIRGAFDILPAKTLEFHLEQKASVHIGKPIEASEYTLANKDELIARVRQEVKALADVELRDKPLT